MYTIYVHILYTVLIHHALILLPLFERFRPLLDEEACCVTSAGHSCSITAAECADGFVQFGNLVFYCPQMSLISMGKVVKCIQGRFTFEGTLKRVQGVSRFSPARLYQN